MNKRHSRVPAHLEPHYAVLAEMLREERIKTTRRAALSMRELGERLEWPHTVIAKIESGERRVDLIELEAICEALDISFRNFLDRYSQRLRKN